MNPAALGVLIIIAAIAIALIGQAFVDHFVRSHTLEHAQKVVGDLFIQTVGGLYGVLVAFLLAGTLATFQSLRGTLTVELNAVVDLARVVQFLPAPAGEEIGSAVRAYARSLAVDELPHLAEGRANPRTTAALSQLWQSIATFAPSTAAETNLHAQALDLVRTVGEQRRILIVATRRNIPALVWWILWIGAGLTVAMSTLSVPPPRKLRFALVAAMAVLVAISLYAFYALSHPFGPVLSIVDPQRLAEVQEMLAPRP